LAVFLSYKTCGNLDFNLFLSVLFNLVEGNYFAHKYSFEVSFIPITTTNICSIKDIMFVVCHTDLCDWAKFYFLLPEWLLIKSTEVT